jgi:hypothetical protein
LVLDLDHAGSDPHAGAALAAYAFSCRSDDPRLADELTEAAGAATRSPVFYPETEVDARSPIVAMAAAIAHRDTGNADWGSHDFDGRRYHYIGLAWAAFHALIGAWVAVLAIPEYGGPAVVHSASFSAGRRPDNHLAGGADAAASLGGPEGKDRC